MTKSRPQPRLPQTITRKILKSGPSNHTFRKVLYGIFTVAARLEEARTYIGGRIAVSGPQFTILMAVAELEGDAGVSVGQVASYLHVTGTFVTIESGKLQKQGYLIKKHTSVDRRVTLLRLTEKAVRALESIAPQLQQINDTVFDLSSRAEFLALCKTFERMVDNSEEAVQLIRSWQNLQTRTRRSAAANGQPAAYDEVRA